MILTFQNATIFVDENARIPLQESTRACCVCVCMYLAGQGLADAENAVAGPLDCSTESDDSMTAWFASSQSHQVQPSRPEWKIDRFPLDSTIASVLTVGVGSATAITVAVTPTV